MSKNRGIAVSLAVAVIIVLGLSDAHAQDDNESEIFSSVI